MGSLTAHLPRDCPVWGWVYRPASGQQNVPACIRRTGTAWYSRDAEPGSPLERLHPQLVPVHGPASARWASSPTFRVPLRAVGRPAS